MGTDAVLLFTLLFGSGSICMTAFTKGITEDYKSNLFEIIVKAPIKLLNYFLVKTLLPFIMGLVYLLPTSVVWYFSFGITDVEHFVKIAVIALVLDVSTMFLVCQIFSFFSLLLKFGASAFFFTLLSVGGIIAGLCAQINPFNQLLILSIAIILIGLLLQPLTQK
jgi:hypothetical protein